jgi:CO/xanthine dehydrogenase FAD-binding subunit
VGPVPLRARAAESWLAERVDWERPAVTDAAAFGQFAALVAQVARPIDDHRSTADYRRHAVRVLAERAAARAFEPGAAA